MIFGSGSAHACAELWCPALAPSLEACAPSSAVSKFSSSCIDIRSTATAFAPPRSIRRFGLGLAFTSLALQRGCLTSVGPMAFRFSSYGLAPVLMPRAAQQISLGKRQQISYPLRRQYACSSRQILDFATVRWLIHCIRLTALHFRSTGVRTYGFYRTSPRGPSSVWHPSGRAVVFHSNALASRCWVPSVRAPGMDFHLLFVAHARHTDSPGGCAASE